METNPDWVDEIVVERVLDGKDPGRDLTRAERAEVIRREIGRGGSTTSAARLVGRNTQQVTKYLRRVQADPQ